MDNVNPKQREMTGWYTEIRGAPFWKKCNSLRGHESEDGKSN